jgi:hypothetical protein
LFGKKIKFTIHQFERSVLEPPMSFGPLSNHQTVVNLWTRLTPVRNATKYKEDFEVSPVSVFEDDGAP